MFTNNFIKYQEIIFNGTHDCRNFVDCGGNTSAKCYIEHSCFGNIGVAIRNAYCKAQTANTSVSNQNSAKLSPGVYFGTGSTQATRDDYKLENPITSGLTIINPGIKSVNGFTKFPIEKQDGRYTYAIPFAVENTTESEIVIREIGLFGEVGTETVAYHVLFERTVLSEPITIAPGEIKLVTYKLTFNQSVS